MAYPDRLYHQVSEKGAIMTNLDKKARSFELNNLTRLLIDFKSLVVDEGFSIYKSGGAIYYIFDTNGFFRIKKTSDFLKLEDFLEEDDYIDANYDELRQVTALKKAEVLDVRYDTESFIFETMVNDVAGLYTIKKHKDTSNIMKNIIALTSRAKLSESFVLATYNVKSQTLTSNIDHTVYPYKITFSDDINFKLKIAEPESLYYIRPLNNGTFIQVVTVSKYSEAYEAQSMLFVFNYLNNREV